VRAHLAFSIVLVSGGVAAADDMGAMQCTKEGCAPVSTHRPGDMTLDAGIGAAKLWLDLPENNASPLTADFQGGAGAYVTRVVALGLRGHVTFGRGPTTMTSLGVDVRWDRGGIFFAATPAIAHVRAPGPIPARSAMLSSTDALAASIELRAGLDLGRAHASLSVMPMYAFANDGFDAQTAMRCGLAVGAAVEVELP
jgi:hypothetical protein